MAQLPYTTTELFHTIYRKKGHPFIALREELGSLLSEARFAPLIMTAGRRSESPVTLALTTILQLAHWVFAPNRDHCHARFWLGVCCTRFASMWYLKVCLYDTHKPASSACCVSLRHLTRAFCLWYRVIATQATP